MSACRFPSAPPAWLLFPDTSRENATVVHVEICNGKLFFSPTMMMMMMLDSLQEFLSASALLEPPKKPRWKLMFLISPLLAGKSFDVGWRLAAQRRCSKKTRPALFIPTLTQNTKYT